MGDVALLAPEEVLSVGCAAVLPAVELADALQAVDLAPAEASAASGLVLAHRDAPDIHACPPAAWCTRPGSLRPRLPAFEACPSRTSSSSPDPWSPCVPSPPA